MSANFQCLDKVFEVSDKIEKKRINCVIRMKNENL